MLPTIAQALGMHGRGRRHARRLLPSHLRGKQVLLVLDNFEQLLAAAPQVGRAAGRAPGLKVLVTSRAPLHVYGEQRVPRSAAGAAGPASAAGLEALSQYAAVALFIERAMAVQARLRRDPQNAPAVAEICVRLDGLPLAIELAAARVRVLSPQAILARLGDRLSLLAGGASNLPERQQTLRGAIGWSHDLLEPVDRVVFARMAVFAGGADLAAVEQVVIADWPAETSGQRLMRSTRSPRCSTRASSVRRWTTATSRSSACCRRSAPSAWSAWTSWSRMARRAPATPATSWPSPSSHPERSSAPSSAKPSMPSSGITTTCAPPSPSPSNGPMPPSPCACCPPAGGSGRCAATCPRRATRPIASSSWREPRRRCS